jgi:hypothetical protein
MQEEQNERTVDRRRLLRGAGTVAVGVAGAGVASAVVASPAWAAPGDPVNQGAVNDAGTTQTTLQTNKADGAALRLENAGGAGLTLDPTSPILDTAPPGSVFVDDFGDISTVGNIGTGNFLNMLYSPTWAKMPEPLLVPVRAVDTRSAGGRTRILNLSALDANGRLKAGATMDVNLSDIADLADAVLMTVAAISATGSGFLTVFPYLSTRPATANVGYAVGRDGNSFVFCGAGFDEIDLDPSTAISIYALAATHVIVDVFGFVVRVPGQVLANFGTATASGAAAKAPSQRDARREAIAKRLPTLLQR